MAARREQIVGAFVLLPPISLTHIPFLHCIVFFLFHLYAVDYLGQ